MLTEQTISKLNEMKLFGMATGFAERISRPDHSKLAHEEFVGLLVDDEKGHRDNVRLQRLLKRAQLKQSAALENVDYRHPRGLDKQTMLELSRAHWITAHQNILISGPTGVGKSYLACALGNQACRLGYSTTYFRFPRLIESLFTARGDGSHLKFLTRLAKTTVVILDDFGLSPLSDRERKDLLEIIEDRCSAASTILTSQLPIKDWHSIIAEPTIADAICDRLFHNAYKIQLKGESLRRSK